MKYALSLLALGLLYIGVGVWHAAAEKYRPEPFPWPSYAGKPSREKPMRRDLSEKLEFGEMYPEPLSKKHPPLAKKAPPVSKFTKYAPPVSKSRPRVRISPPMPEQKPFSGPEVVDLPPDNVFTQPLPMEKVTKVPFPATEVTVVEETDYVLVFLLSLTMAYLVIILCVVWSHRG